MPSRSLFGRMRFGRDRFGGMAAGEVADSVVQDLYSLDVRNGSNTILARLPNWTSGRHTEAVNTPSLLEFVYPYDDEHRDLLVGPNMVGLFDQYGDLIDRLRIVKYRKVRGEDGRRYVLVKARGLLAQLGHEMLTSFSASSQTVNTIVKNLLAEQVITDLSHVRKGSFASAIGSTTTSLELENESILAGLHKIQGEVGGFFWVNHVGQLRWVRGFKKTHQWLQVGHNLPGLEVEYDDENIKTRVTVYGQGATPDTRESATANNATAQSTYGIRLHTISMPNESDATRLQNVADEWCRLLSKPRKRIRAPALDLSMANQRLDYSHEAIKVGRKVTVVDGDIDETIETLYLKVSRDLASPMHVTVELQDTSDIAQDAAGFGGGTSDAYQSIAKPFPDIIDVIADLMKKLDDLTLRDPGFETSILESLWDTTAHTGTLDELLEDVFGNDTDTVNAIADDIMPDVIDAIEASPSDIQDLATALANDGTAASTLQAAIDTDTQLTLSDATPQDVNPSAGAAGSSGDTSRADHEHKGTDISLYTGTPAADTASGSAGSSSDASKGDHAHQRSTLYPRVWRQATAPSSGMVGGDLWEDTNDGSGPNGENQIYIYEAGNTSWVAFLLLT
jgi:phage minor structural protein